MTAYIVVDIDGTDPVGYADYKEAAQWTIPIYGGKYIVRGGKTETQEGDWLPNRFVILEFPSSEKAKAWLNSPEYAPARSLRHKCAKSQMILVEGVS